MKNRYRVYKSWTEREVKELKSYGIVAEVGAFAFDLADNEISIRVLNLAKDWGANIAWKTDYSKQEVEASEILVYDFSKSIGYPEPSLNGGYLAATYNLENYCTTCGSGHVQKNPFRLSKAPNWKGHLIFQLGWTFDEIFVHEDIYHNVFEKFGVGGKEVVLDKTGKRILDVIQLDIPMTSSKLEMGEQPFELCDSCGVKKYLNQILGLFPRLAIQSNLEAAFKSEEYFGTGLMAFKRIFFSKELRVELEKQKVKQAYIPMNWP